MAVSAREHAAPRGAHGTSQMLMITIHYALTPNLSVCCAGVFHMEAIYSDKGMPTVGFGLCV